MGKHKIIKSAAAVALTASVVATAAPGASAASYKTNAKDQLVHTSTGKLVKGWKVFGGKLYKNGKLAPAKKYKIIGTGAAQKLFYGPTLKKGYKTANSKTLLFKDGKLADGWKQAGKNERLYKNGKLDKGYTVYTNVEGDKFLYQNGKLKKGQKTATRGGETLLFVDGKLAKGYVLHEASKTLFNNGKVAEGLVKYPETDGKFYNDGKLADGEINGVTYKDGVIVAKDVASVKAINDTTVEVTFKEAQKAENIKAADFKIEGLTVSNAALKQTDSKVVVLTTSKQEAAKEYVITYKENDTKTFVGFNAAIPTAIKSTEVKPYQTSQQAKIGEQVTVKATVTVAEGANKAGIPVTFVVDNNKDTASGNNANQGKDQTVEVLTDENGVASYTYTQYAESTDTVTAYPTGAPTQRTSTKVFWGVTAHQLAVEDVTKETTLANKGTKQYKVTGTPGTTYKIALAENYEVAPDKVNHNASVIADGGVAVTPYQTTVAGKADASKVAYITTNAKGEATFTVSGSDTSVTPVVFKDDQNTSSQAGFDRLNSAELQATASTVKFENVQTVALTNEAQGVQLAAAKTAKGQGGRSYKAVVKTTDGTTTAPKGTTVYLKIADEADKAASIKGKLHVFNAEGIEVTADAKGNYALTTNKDGVVEYTITSDVKNNYATPVVFLENGSKGSATAPELDANDTQATAQLTYFGDEKVEKATIKYYKSATFTDANEITKAEALAKDGKVYVEYQTVDQNGFDYAPEEDGLVTFNFTTTFGDVTVKDLAGNTVAAQPVIGNTNGVAKLKTEAGKIQFSLESTKASTINITTNSSTISSEPTVFKFTGVGSKTLAETVTAVNNAEHTDAAIYAALTGYSKFDELETAQKSAVAAAVKAEAQKGAVTGTQITDAIATAQSEDSSNPNPPAKTQTLAEAVAATNASNGKEADVKAALEGYAAFDELTDAQQDAVVTSLVGSLPTTALTGPALTTLIENTAKTYTLKAAKYTAADAGTAAKASATYTNATTPANTLKVEATNTGAAYNGIKVKFAKGTTATTTATYDAATKTINVALGINTVTGVVTGEFTDVKSEIEDITEFGGVDVTVTGLTGAATELVGQELTLVDGKDTTTATFAELELTYDQDVKLTTGAANVVVTASNLTGSVASISVPVANVTVSGNKVILKDVAANGPITTAAPTATSEITAITGLEAVNKQADGTTALTLVSDTLVK